jgi:hypothetical protein
LTKAGHFSYKSHAVTPIKPESREAKKLEGLKGWIIPNLQAF